jgi:hypothetical protein
MVNSKKHGYRLVPFQDFLKPVYGCFSRIEKVLVKKRLQSLALGL